MKKIVSLLLALVMVLSLGVAAFAAPAAGEEDTPKAEETPWVTVDQILQWVKDTIIPNLNMDLMKEVIKQTKATIDNIVELLKPLFDKNQNLLPGYGQEYADTLMAYMPDWILPVLLIAAFVSGLVGGLIGRKIFKKHFERAGIV